MTPEDMKALWASHCRYEFELRDVEGALSTMVDDPYLWNIPTMCGGRGQDGMRRYYRDNFVGTMPADAGISSVSLTVGVDQIAEEVILTFTHDREMPWLLRIERSQVQLLGGALPVQPVQGFAGPVPVRADDEQRKAPYLGSHPL